jgi:hypothetical protein
VVHRQHCVQVCMSHRCSAFRWGRSQARPDGPLHRSPENASTSDPLSTSYRCTCMSSHAVSSVLPSACRQHGSHTIRNHNQRTRTARQTLLLGEEVSTPSQVHLFVTNLRDEIYQSAGRQPTGKPWQTLETAITAAVGAEDMMTHHAGHSLSHHQGCVRSANSTSECGPHTRQSERHICALTHRHIPGRKATERTGR